MRTSVLRRLAIHFLADLLLWGLAAPLAFVLRLEGDVAAWMPELAAFALVGLGVKALTLYALGVFRSRWSHAGVRDVILLAGGVAVASLVLAGLAFFFPERLAVPRSVPLLDGMLGLLLLGGARLAARVAVEQRERIRRGPGRTARRVLVVGAGEAGLMIVREMQRRPRAGRRPVGFLDDDPAKRRRAYLGLRVLGPIDALPQVVRKKHVDEVLIAIPSASGATVRRVVERARAAGVDHRIIPSIQELLDGRVTVSQIREVDVEDLLRREPVRLDLDGIAATVRGRVVLVTGAGGSIGAEIARQAARFEPERLVLLGRGEGSLYRVMQQLEEAPPAVARRAVLADIRDRATLEHLFATERPEVVFHAAAHKHVPLLERHPAQAVFNNVGGTRNLVELALAHGVERFVNISTDKAVDPTSVMGASKRVAEQVVHEAARRAAAGQSFVSVRFGNVLGSRGSVVPLFRRQIERGGPVTVTHPEMRRYFMTIPEAAQLVLQAVTLADNGAVCVLDMGRPVRIVDLARDLIRLSGLEPGRDVEIVFTGTRPGEKMVEELLTAEEGAEATRHEKVFIARSTDPADDAFPAALDALFDAARAYDDARIRAALGYLVPSFRAVAEQEA